MAGTTRTETGRRTRRLARGLARGGVAAAAVLFAGQLLLGFTGLPRGLTDWLCGRRLPACERPTHIVVLGGGGIPSATGLIRTYYAAAFGRAATQAVFIVALPAAGEPERQSVGRMRDELVLRGIPAEAIRLETRGRNTREQAANIRALLGPPATDERVVLVTSPTHIRRAVLCFRRAGFARATGLPADNTAAEGDPGPRTQWRYGFWNNLTFQIEVARELTALLVYRLRGWL